MVDCLLPCHTQAANPQPPGLPSEKAAEQRCTPTSTGGRCSHAVAARGDQIPILHPTHSHPSRIRTSTMHAPARHMCHCQLLQHAPPSQRNACLPKSHLAAPVRAARRPCSLQDGPTKVGPPSGVCQRKDAVCPLQLCLASPFPSLQASRSPTPAVLSQCLLLSWFGKHMQQPLTAMGAPRAVPWADRAGRGPAPASHGVLHQTRWECCCMRGAAGSLWQRWQWPAHCQGSPPRSG
jgi:hypothetical protein